MQSETSSVTASWGDARVSNDKRQSHADPAHHTLQGPFTKQAIGNVPEENSTRSKYRMLLHPGTGEILRPTLSPAEAADVLGWPERTVREYARQGLLPTMTRPGSRGQHRIITAKLLEMLGLD